jgi:hypothetical protein
MIPAFATGEALACTRCNGALEPEDLRCPLCGLACADHSGAAPERARAEVLRCDGCGAALAYSAEHRAAQCGFCGSALHIEAPSDPIEQAEHLLPFRVGDADARRALAAWLGSRGFFRPSDLASASTIADMKPLFWAGWLCEAQAMVSFTGDSDAGAERSRWAPHAGQAPMHFQRLVVSGSRGLSWEETAALVPLYDLSSAQPASSADPRALIERFELQRSAARQLIGAAIHGTAAANVQRDGLLPGSTFRNVKVSVLLEKLATHRVAFPAWVLAYHYRGKLYRAIVHGHDARFILGTSPVSIGKILLVVFLVLAALAFAMLAVGTVLAIASQT